MYEQNILDQQAFAREATIASAVANPYLESGKVLIAETGLFYDVVTTNSTGAIALTNGKFLKHIENLKINGNVLKGSITVTASQVPQDANNRFITDTERTNWNNKSNKTVQMIAGNGLTGGGTLEANRTFNVVSANDGIVVNADNIQLSPVNALNSTSTTRPLTAAQGKVLEDKKLNLSGGTMSGELILPRIKFNTGKEIRLDYNSSGWSYLGNDDSGFLRFKDSGGMEFSKNLNITGTNTATKFIGPLEGNANTATTLQTARTIGGVSFNGSANINLPGVNTQGNQNTTGNAATATKLQTARTIGGVSFNGTANINLPGVNTTGNQNTTGSAATLTTARTLTVGNTGKTFNGSGNVAWSLNEIGASLGQSISATTPATAGWYRIATSSLGVNRNGGVFTIHTTVSGNHSTTILTAGINYASGIALNQLSHSAHGSAINKARIVYHTTYSGNYAYLEVYLNAAVASNINVYISNPIGWSLVAPNTAGSIPSGYTNYEITLAANKIVSDLNGNSSSATKLQTARQINGTNFDGTGNITTANWGTARTLTIGSTGKSVNGSANVSWSLAELGLGNVNNTADSAKNVLSATKLTTARTIGGVSFDGTANINLPGVNTAGNQNTTGNANSATILQNTRTINGTNFNGSANITTANWGTARNIQIGNTTKSVNGSGNVSWSLSEIGAPHASGRQAATVDMNSLRTTGFYGLHSGMPNASSNYGSLIVAANSDTGLQISGGYSNDHLKFRGWSSSGSSFTAWRTVYHDGYKPLADAATKLQTARTIGGVSFDGTSNINLPGVNTAGNQSTSGNSATATKLQNARQINGTNFDGSGAITTANWGTARTLTIGNTGKSVNGSGNVSWSTREIGALPLNTVNGCPNPAYYLSTSTSTTRTKIRLPYKSNAGKMVVFTIRVYQSYQHFDLQISGYLYGSTNQWHAPRATMISGTISVEVKMGRDTDGYAYVSINGGDYRGVAVIDVVGGYSNADWSTGWLITATNDLANVEYTITVYPPYSPNNKPTATDVGLGNVPNTVHTTAATANTVAVRDSSGDINVRLLRPNYADQSTISGAMAFRINNGSDNYIRFCNNVTNIRNWLGAAASSHNHDASNITAGTLAVARGGTGTTSSTGSGANVLNTSPTFVTQATSPRFYASDWFRSTGNTGWYSETHGGGIMMQDTTWVRVHNSKSFYVANQIAATGNITAYYSDKRLKKDFKEVDNCLEKINKITPYYYKQNEFAEEIGYEKNKKQQLGFIAQEIKEVLPEVIQKAPINLKIEESDNEEAKRMQKEEEFMTIDYQRMVPLLLGAIKEQQIQIEELKSQIKELINIDK
ncbi:MAG: tail fiber domain-containing protein [Cetobacterium sp.]